MIPFIIKMSNISSIYLKFLEILRIIIIINLSGFISSRAKTVSVMLFLSKGISIQHRFISSTASWGMACDASASASTC